jgi:hypothetical protein
LEFSPSDASRSSPFWAKLATVRCAFRWALSIVSCSGTPGCATKAAKMCSNTPQGGSSAQSDCRASCALQPGGASFHCHAVQTARAAKERLKTPHLRLGQYRQLWHPDLPPDAFESQQPQPVKGAKA